MEARCFCLYPCFAGTTRSGLLTQTPNFVWLICSPFYVIKLWFTHFVWWRHAAMFTHFVCRIHAATIFHPLCVSPVGKGGTTLLSFRLLRKPDPCRSSDDDTKLCLVNFPLRFDLGKLVLWICQIIRRLAFLPFPKSDRHFTLTMPTDAFNLDSCFGT